MAIRGQEPIRGQRTPKTGTLREVYAVHVDHRDHTGQTEVIYHQERHARAHALVRSTDTGISGVTITRYTVDVHGARMPVAWYVDGTEQRTPWPN